MSLPTKVITDIGGNIILINLFIFVVLWLFAGNHLQGYHPTDIENCLVRSHKFSDV